MLAEAQEGLYDEGVLAAVPRADKSRFFTAARGDRGAMRVGDDLRALVSFRELNLIGQWPMKGKFDVIFCRNVVIYFDEPTQERIWGRFADCLVPNGLLCIGHSERVAGAALPLFTTAATTAYRRVGRVK